MANDDVRSKIILGSELSQTDDADFLSRYDDLNNDSDNESVGKFNSELLWRHHLERIKKITQPCNDVYNTSNVIHNHVTTTKLIDLTGNITDSYENTTTDNSIDSVQNNSVVDKIHPILKIKLNTISEMVNLCYNDEESFSYIDSNKD